MTNTVPSPSKIISEDTITTHFHWKKQQHLQLVKRCQTCLPRRTKVQRYKRGRGRKSTQPRSQALSPLPPFVVGRKTLVAAGHVTTQNLGGKKICWVGGVAEYFDCCCGKLCGFQNLEQSLKSYPLYRVRSRILPIKKATLFLPSPKYRRLSFTKQFGSRMELKISDGYHL